MLLLPPLYPAFPRSIPDISLFPFSALPFLVSIFAFLSRVCFCFAFTAGAADVAVDNSFGSLESDLERLRAGLRSAPRSSAGQLSFLEMLNDPAVTSAGSAHPEDTVVIDGPLNEAGNGPAVDPTAAAAAAAAAAAGGDAAVTAPDMPGAQPLEAVATPTAADAAAAAAAAAPAVAPPAADPSAAPSAAAANAAQAAAATPATPKAAPIQNPANNQNGAAKSTRNINTNINSVRSALSGNVDNIGAHLNNIVNDVSSIVRSKESLKAALNNNAASQATALDAAANKIVDDGTQYLRGQSARTSKDVLDCTACRFAWLHVEVDLGNTYSEKALYDAFVHHCAEMQMSRLFFSACNDMFVQVDDMIGDYLNGHTVNQLCMNARMCR